MPKACIAIGAFVLGFFCSIMLGVPQSQHPGPSAPTVQWPDKHTFVFEGGGVRGGHDGVDMASIGAVPFFNTLDHMPVFRRFTFLGGGQSLDGLNCEDCNFDNARLRYGGGVVNLKGSTFSGTTEL